MIGVVFMTSCYLPGRGWERKMNSRWQMQVELLLMHILTDIQKLC